MEIKHNSQEEYLSQKYETIKICEIRQAQKELKEYVDVCNGEVGNIVLYKEDNGYKKNIDILDLAIADYEITLNNLNDAKTILGDYKKENEELKKQLVDNSQAIEPSVLEKIDKLEKENGDLKWQKDNLRELRVDLNMKIEKLEKQLAITDKALDKAINLLINNGVGRTKEELKESLLKESEKEQ